MSKKNRRSPIFVIMCHELNLGRKALLIWTAVISLFIAACVFIYPEMETEMESIGDTFASMGSFTKAFGLDKLNFGEFIGFYGIECGNILGIGGALFAALTGVTALCKEEKEHTADFLLTNPVSRNQVVCGKLLTMLIQLLIFNIAVFAVLFFSAVAIGEKPDWGQIALIHLANTLMQIEIASVCFCLSSYIRRSGLGIGLGIATLTYFLNIIANLSESAKSLKYFTPFAYADSSDIIFNSAINTKFAVIGIIVSVVLVATAFIQYNKKDIL